MRRPSILLGVGLILALAGFASGLATAGPASGSLRVLPSNPRYFTADGARAVYLTGSHTHSNFQDQGLTYPPPRFDYRRYLDFLREHNHNFVRLWMWESARWMPGVPGDFYTDPMPYARTGPGLAIDGRRRFNLDLWNPAFFERLRARVVAAGEQGIYVAVMLFEGWSVEPLEKLPGNPWAGHPFNRYNNVNGIDGDVNYDNAGREVHTMDPHSKLKAVRRLQERYVRHVIDTLGDLDNVLWEIGNEIGSHSIEWQYHMIDLIRQYERARPKQHPIGMTFPWPDGHNRLLFESPADWISPNELGGYKQNPPPGDGRKVILSDTDHLWGIGGTSAWVWKSFLRGLHPIYMDPYGSPHFPPADPLARQAMGLTRRYATRMNLAAMQPMTDMASSRFALADPGSEYLVYLPDEETSRPTALGGLVPHRVQRWLNRLSPPHPSVRLDLSSAPRTLRVEWLNPRTGETQAAQDVLGGRPATFTAPFAGDAVLYLSVVNASAARRP